MTATELAHLSLSELKSICRDRAITVVGDRRLKATYINAIITLEQHHQEPVVPHTAVIADPFDETIELPVTTLTKIEDDRHRPLKMPESTAPNNQLSHPHRNASIVLLVPLIFALALFLAVKTTIISLAWSISRLAPLISGLWRSILEYRKPDRSIDYFPSLA